MRCWVYVDGFNFYHGACLRTAIKWVDLLKLGQQIRPSDTIERVKFFTALVEKRTDDPDQRKRQRTYWKALDTLGVVQRIEGQFARWPGYLPLERSVETLEALEKRGCDVSGIKPIMMKVLRSEEKGSDVNLGAHLVHDSHLAAPTFDVALVVSSDADLKEAIRIVVQEVGKPVYVCRPNPAKRTRVLDSVATSTFDITGRMMKASLFPPTLTDASGNTITKPAAW